ncbi:MAG: nucleoside-diphosphate sugar epimerase/dehydratase, partial [Planctomycetota bacterium]
MTEQDTKTVPAGERPDDPKNGSWFMDLIVRHRLLFNLVVHNALFALALLLAYLVWFGAVNQVLSGNRRLMLDKAESKGWPQVVVAELRKAAEQDPGWFTQQYLFQLPFFLLVKSIVFGRSKLFRGWWRYAGIRDVANIVLASWFCLMIFYLIVVVFYWLPGQLNRKPLLRQYSDGVLVLDFMATVFLISAARLGVRLYREEYRPVSAEGVRRVLVVGAGNAGETLLREIHKMHVERYRVTGLVDDDPNKEGTFIHGIPVLGTTDDIKTICEGENIDEILIAVPSATQKELRRIIENCEGTKLNFQTLPSMNDLIDGRVTASQIRKVEIRDLLGRKAVELDTGAIGH